MRGSHTTDFAGHCQIAWRRQRIQDPEKTLPHYMGDYYVWAGQCWAALRWPISVLTFGYVWLSYVRRLWVGFGSRKKVKLKFCDFSFTFWVGFGSALGRLWVGFGSIHGSKKVAHRLQMATKRLQIGRKWQQKGCKWQQKACKWEQKACKYAANRLQMGCKCQQIDCKSQQKACK